MTTRMIPEGTTSVKKTDSPYGEAGVEGREACLSGRLHAKMASAIGRLGNSTQPAAGEDEMSRPIYRDGYLELPNKPGLGIELNEEVCRAHLVKGSGFFDD